MQGNGKIRFGFSSALILNNLLNFISISRFPTYEKDVNTAILPARLHGNLFMLDFQQL